MKPSTYTPLFTDLYQLTMAYGYWRLGLHERQAVFHLLFRSNPFKGNYAVHCGLESVVDYLTNWTFQKSELDYLATLKNVYNEPLFPTAFLTYLEHLKFTCDLDAIPEGTVVFPHTPLLRVTGPLLQCQLLETPLLNMTNFQTLIATKATRICRAAGTGEVIEFGMRRAQGPDGALSASRAAYVGGCVATSNTLAGMLFDIPVRGTHAHSWVTAFESELEAFNAYAKVLPHHAIFLVDTYDSLKGVEHAIEVGQKLRAEGAELLGIRLDSGDLAKISIQARERLDAAGFQKTTILASNALDEKLMIDLKKNGAKIDAWGVGTHLATAYDQPALDGVYKLGALQQADGTWVYKLKLSEEVVKISNPGQHQVRRFYADEKMIMDVIYDLNLGIDSAKPKAILFEEKASPMASLKEADHFNDLLVPIFRKGQRVLVKQSIHTLRSQALKAVNSFYHQYKKQSYPIALEENLYQLKRDLSIKLKNQTE